MSTPRTSSTLEAILKGLQIFNSLKPVLDQAFENEANRLGLTRDERKALSDRLFDETDKITDEDMSPNP
jgi:hypothetical protein